jgi:hypothetical protein
MDLRNSPKAQEGQEAAIHSFALLPRAVYIGVVQKLQFLGKQA